METTKLKDVIENFEGSTDTELSSALIKIKEDFESTRKYIIDLTYKLDTIESTYNKLYKELDKRIKDNGKR